MTYFITIFSPDTYRRFEQSKRDVSAVKPRQQKAAERVEVGDRLIAYLTGVSRFVGLFEVTGTMFTDKTPIFADKDDPFVVRLPIKSLVFLSVEHALPIHDPALWSKLSFTREHEVNSTLWTGSV